MGLDAVAALEDALDRVLTRSGAVVALLFVLGGLVELPVQQTLSAHLWDRLLDVEEVRAALREQYGDVMVPENPLSLGFGIEATLALLAVLFVVVVALRVFAIGTFAGDEDAGVADPLGEGFLRAFALVLSFELALIGVSALLLGGPALVGGASGGVNAVLLLGYLVALAVLLTLPVLLYFARQAIVLDGEGPLAAIRRSYALARANVVPILVLLLTVFVASVIGGVALGTALPDGPVAPIVTTAYQRLVAVFGIAVSTQAFLQVRS